ncbi:ribonuclease HII [Nanobdella aerobiophila]|uniref:Ribonuclease HII n=1 Tax=Nanobdella aerobiophila TaxID=2586965 RepID=A0A915SI58_9ARCH|nr:hypothetical protein [Nanobdella aerobiophila]BBL45422.1 ribonuclease HII [Nanobdella aerobiophila]
MDDNRSYLLYLDANILIKGSSLEKLLEKLENNKVKYKVAISKKSIEEAIRNIDNKEQKKDLYNILYGYKIPKDFYNRYKPNYLIEDIKYRVGKDGYIIDIKYRGIKRYKDRKISITDKYYGIEINLYKDFQSATVLFTDLSDLPHLDMAYYFSRSKNYIPIILTYDGRIVKDNPKVFRYIVIVSPDKLYENISQGKNIKQISKYLEEKKKDDLYNKMIEKHKKNGFFDL